MDEKDALPDVLDDLVATLLRLGFTVTDRRVPDQFGDQSIEFTHGHRGVLVSRERGRWSLDVRLIDRWFTPNAVELALEGGKVSAPTRGAKTPSLEEQALSTLGVVQTMPTSAATLRDLRDDVVLSHRRRRAPFLGNWDRRR